MSDARPLSAAERGRIQEHYVSRQNPHAYATEWWRRYEATVTAAHSLLEEARGALRASDDPHAGDCDRGDLYDYPCSCGLPALLHRIDKALEGEG